MPHGLNRSQRGCWQGQVGSFPYVYGPPFPGPHTPSLRVEKPSWLSRKRRPAQPPSGRACWGLRCRPAWYQGGRAGAWEDGTLYYRQQDDNHEEEEGDVEDDPIDLVLVTRWVLDLVADATSSSHTHVHVEHVALRREAPAEDTPPRTRPGTLALTPPASLLSLSKALIPGPEVLEVHALSHPISIL